MQKLKSLALLGIVAVILLIGLIIGTAWLDHRRNLNPPTIASTATILKQVQSLSQLVTVKYVMEKVVVLEDPKRWLGMEIPGGDNRVLLLAHGIVKAGIDFTQMQESDIQVSDKKVVVRMPHPILTDAYLDDTQTRILERSTGMLRVFDKNLEQNARRQAVGEISHAARESGITKDAEDRARTHLLNLFHQLGFTDVEIKSKSSR